jgi:uncharacterized membrane protein YhaH (DUF805 family)
MIRAVPPGDRRREYWSWAAGALYVLLTLDFVTTLYADALYGSTAEVNPLMRWALQQGVPTLVVVNLAALLLLAVLFEEMIELTLRAPDRHRAVVALAFEVWIALVLAAGFVVFANNLSVIVHGQGLEFALLQSITG